MKTLEKQISLFGEERSTFLLEGFRANHTAKPENDLEKQMTATSGRNILGQFKRLPRATSWAKTFMGLLIGTEGWYSTRSRLTRKLKGTKCNRLYFQLYPSTLPTEEIGSGLWPTATTVQRDHPERVEKLKATGAKTMMSRKAGENRPNSILDAAMFKGMIPTVQTQGLKVQQRKTEFLNLKLLPTPNTMDHRTDVRKPGEHSEKAKKGGCSNLREKVHLLPTPTVSGEEKHETRAKRQGHKKAMSYLEANVEFQMEKGLMFTPTVNDAGNSTFPESQKGRNSLPGQIIRMYPTPQASEGTKITGKENQNGLTKMARKTTGKTSQLNPRFVAEMMGFPPKHTEEPFKTKIQWIDLN